MTYTALSLTLIFVCIPLLFKRIFETSDEYSPSAYRKLNPQTEFSEEEDFEEFKN